MLLNDPSDAFLCYVHINHSRYAQKVAMKALPDGTTGITTCIFSNDGCASSARFAEGRLWRLPVIDVDSPDTLEAFSDLEDTVASHSDGSLHAVEVMGKLCCRSCLYIVMQGKDCARPAISLNAMPSSVDRAVVRFILFSLASSAVAACSPLLSGDVQGNIAEVAQNLRIGCIVSGGSEKVVRMLPFQEVCRCRKLLVRSFSTYSSERDIDDRTLQKRVESPLAGKGVILRKLSYRLRCYVCVDQIDDMLALLASSSSSSICARPRESLNQMRSHLQSVIAHFGERKKFYWRGEWSLTEEVASIPKALWVDTILQMSSQRRILSWSAAAKAVGGQLEDMFPVSNSCDVLPTPSIEQELCSGHRYSRADLLICVRALKVIEQLALSRSNGVAGPLTVCLSVSGICEVTPSFVSALNAMGLFLSYTVTERYRQKLIAERERRGPWDFSIIGEDSIPVLQFDNWDIKPLHAVKVDGKEMPKVNGSLLQGQMRGKRHIDSNEYSAPAKRVRMGSWKDASDIGSRDEFIRNITNVEHTVLLNKFNDIVFGLVCLYRQQLVGGKEAASSEYNSGTRGEFRHGVDGVALNFRSLLLSAFKPHGGRPVTDDSLHDQHVVYVDISRDSAADILTVRRFLNMISTQLRPGDPGRPRYIVIGGDQPSYKMFVELWLESWRKSKYRRDSTQSVVTEPVFDGPELHEWLIPFPGFFHAEKQAMYSLCKEMLDGLGLEELAGCAGLSNSHVANFMKHSHARNNRAVLFNLACSMIVHLTDLTLLEDATLCADVEKMHRMATEKHVSQDSSQHTVPRRTPVPPSEEGKGSLYEATTDIVTPDVVSIGEKLRRKVQSRFSVGPNGKHFVHTVLFCCLLPTIGFHVLSRTGHTHMVLPFWFKHNGILHSSTHLKYQELSIFFAFFRAILPTVVSEELFTNTPGRMVMKLLSFTGKGRFGVDRWGFGYAHSDEALEMLIVRHLKTLSFNFLAHLENSSAWLMEVSMFRSLVRYMTGASRSFGRKREEADGGESLGPIAEFDRNACQWKTVARMLHVMREVGFLSVSHRGAEWLTNVFSAPPKRMNIKTDQDSLLNVEKNGELTSKLHASVLFPDVFGALTEQDRSEHFGGKKFRKWTKSRAVLRAAKSMSKLGGSVVCSESGASVARVVVPDDETMPKRPRSKEAYSKVLQDRRRKISKMKDAYHDEERAALRVHNDEYLKEILKRWDILHVSRYLVSPFADCFFNNNGHLNHGAKSKFLKYSARGNRDIMYSMNELQRSGRCNSRNRGAVSRNLFDYRLPGYLTVQVDVMNAIHYRGDTGGRGTSLQGVVTGKMKTVLRAWIAGPRARWLRQLHLHVDDPSLVLLQKNAEQARRDSKRAGSDVVMEGVHGASHSFGIGFQEDLNVPWSSLLTDRGYKDELASLHLICGAMAALELLSETGQDCRVFLHGGSFIAPKDFNRIKLSELKPNRFPDGGVFDRRKGGVLLSKCGTVSIDMDDHIVIPRSRCLIFDTDGTADIGGIDILHGEAETRFVSVANEYITGDYIRESQQAGTRGRHGTSHEICDTLIVSDDTDVFMIMLANPSMHGRGVLHVINDSIHSVDAAIDALGDLGTCGRSLATLYCIAGCDFSPSITGLAHDVFWRAFLVFLRHGGCILPPDGGEEKGVDLLFCILYLVKMGRTILCTEVERRGILHEAERNGSRSVREIAALKRTFFVSDNVVGTRAWLVDVRNLVADNSNAVNEMIPHAPHITLHWNRAIFVSMKYWGKAVQRDLSCDVVGGCTALDGYKADGTVLVELTDDVKNLLKVIHDVVTTCNCKGKCDTRRCSCFKNAEKCIGCGCSEEACKNRAIPAKIQQMQVEPPVTEEQRNPNIDTTSPILDVVAMASNVLHNGEEEGSGTSDSENASDCSSDEKSSVTTVDFEQHDIIDVL